MVWEMIRIKTRNFKFEQTRTVSVRKPVKKRDIADRLSELSKDELNKIAAKALR